MQTSRIVLITSFLLFCLVTSQQAWSGSVEYFSSQRNIDKQFPFSNAVRVGDLLFLSGEIGTLPNSSQLIEGGIKAQSKQTMLNIQANLAQHNLSMNDLVKCTVMLADIKEWSTFNQVYKGFFPKHYPARSAFAASGLALNARVEVECIAAFSD